MAVQKNSFAQRIRQAAMELSRGGRSVTLKELSIQAGLVNRVEKKRMSNAMCDFLKAGEVERLSQGVYRYLGKKNMPVEKRLVMWRLLKMRRSVTVADLQELAGASRHYAWQWLSSLIRQDVVQKLGNGKYRLVKDVAEMPEDEERAGKLRELRAEKKVALGQILDRASVAIDEARDLIADI